MSGQWNLVLEEATANQAVVPINDGVEHIFGPHCLCRPAWKALWHGAKQSVVWQFVHHSLDGRELRE